MFLRYTYDIIALSSIGMNEKSFFTLRERFNVIETFEYQGYYPYTVEDMQCIASNGYQLVTTEKDWHLPETKDEQS